MNDSNMKQAELMLRLVLYVSIGAAILRVIGSVWAARQFGPQEYQMHAPTIRAVLTYVGHLGVAIWLYVLAKQYGATRWVWFLLGIVFSIYAVIVFYIVRMHNMLESQLESNKET